MSMKLVDLVPQAGSQQDVFRKAKIAALQEMVRIAVARPDRDQAFSELAAAIENDWFPMMSVSRDGTFRVEPK